MALEFCLYKEKGNTIVEDKLNEYGIKEQSLMKTLTQNISVKIKTEGLENADAQILEKLESDMNSYLASKLKEASFNSKLQRNKINLVRIDHCSVIYRHLPTLPCRVCLDSRHTLHLCFKSHHAKMG